MTRYWLAHPAPDGDPVRLLSLAQPGQARGYFSARGSWDLAAIGSALALEADGSERLATLSASARCILGELEQIPSAGPEDVPSDLEPLLLGGFSFAPEWSVGADSCWAGFAPGRLVLPELALLRREGRSYFLAVAPEGLDRCSAEQTLRAKVGRVAEALVGGFRDSLPSTSSSAGLGVSISAGSRQTYESRVRSALTAIVDGDLSKVTVARHEELRADAPVDVARLLVILRDRFPKCFVFCVQPPGAAAFVGASPEQLIACRGGLVRADALAGTAARGASAGEDDSLAEGLSSSPKEQREHAAVVDYLRAALEPVTVHLHAADEPGLLRLANVQHLHTPFTGQLQNGEGVLELASRLHPTPAVAGLPRSAALSWLAEEEDLDRGWYAGGVGVVDSRGDGEFCVAIRSGLVSGSSLRIFAGAGIVEGSEPAREGAEVDQKLRGLREALLHA